MYKVLLVDDEILVREAISENLKWNDLGYDLVATCKNGKEAKQYIQNNGVDVVITDICMPIMDGIELSEFIYSDFPDISIIIFSGFAEFEYAQKAIKCNVEEYMLKPVTAAELSKALLGVKSRRDEEREDKKRWKSVSATSNKNRKIIQSKILLDFITGNKTYEDIAEELNNFSIRFDSKYYRVAVIDIIRYQKSLTIDDQAKPYNSLIAFSVQNISEEILNVNHAGLICSYNNERMLVIFDFDDVEDIRTKVKKTSLDIKVNVKEFLDLDVIISLGEVVTSKEDIHKSYETVDNVAKYEYLFGQQSVIDIEDFPVLASDINKIFNLEDYVDDLSFEITSNNCERIEQIINGILRDLKESLTNKTLCISYLQRIVLDIYNNLHISDLIDKEEVLINLQNTYNLSEGIEIVQNYCNDIASILSANLESTNKRRASLAMDYLEKNHFDPNLSLSEVCSYLDISSSRFSTIFKNETGETFNEALTRIRIDKSKELIEYYDLKNYEIAEKVGIADPHYFSVVFKKMTGQSPTEYKKDINNNK